MTRGVIGKMKDGRISLCNLKEKGRLGWRLLLFLSFFKLLLFPLRFELGRLLCFYLNQGLGNLHRSLSNRHESCWASPLIHWNRATILPCWLYYFGIETTTFLFHKKGSIYHRDGAVFCPRSPDLSAWELFCPMGGSGRAF